MKHRASAYLGVGLLGFLVFLSATFPARVAYQWFAPEGVQISGIAGSVWNGTAREMSAYGLHVLQPTWRMKPQYVALGKFAYSIAGRTGSGSIDTDLSVSFAGTVTMTDLNATLSLGLLQNTVSVPGLAGEATVRLERLQIVDGLPVAVDGVVEVFDLTIPVVHPLSIGGYRAEFFTQQDEVAASVEDTDGILDLAGSLSIGADRNFSFLGRVAAKAETPDSLRQQMRLLGSADERGQYELRLEGQL